MNRLPNMKQNDLESISNGSSYSRISGTGLSLPSVFNGNLDEDFSSFYGNNDMSGHKTNMNENNVKLRGIISVSELESQILSNEQDTEKYKQNEPQYYKGEGNENFNYYNNNNNEDPNSFNPNRDNDKKFKGKVNNNKGRNYRRKDKKSNPFNQFREHIVIDPKIEDSLTQSIIELYETLLPTKEEVEKRLNLLTRLRQLFDKSFEGQNPELILYGSSANGLTIKNADIDLCFKFTLKNDEEVPMVIDKLANILQDEKFVVLLTLPWARCPIIKFKDPDTNIKCDVCLNNELALRNTKLISDYINMDIRAKQLGLIIKYWAKRRKINDPYTGTLSSYAFIILLINFLQRCNPPILPCLQQMRDENDTEEVFIDGFDCYYYTNVEDLKGFSQQNVESLGSLLIGFFHLYSEELDYRNDVVSIRTGRYLTKREKNWTLQDGDFKTHHFLAIEDPFEVTHNLARTSELDAVIGMRKEFGRAYRLAMSEKPLGFICKYYKL